MLEKQSDSSINLDQFDFKKNQRDGNFKDKFSLTFVKVSTALLAAFMTLGLNYYVYTSLKKEAEVLSLQSPVSSIKDEKRVIDYFSEDINLVELMNINNQKKNEKNFSYKISIPNSDLNSRSINQADVPLLFNFEGKDLKIISAMILPDFDKKVRVHFIVSPISQEEVNQLSNFLIVNQHDSEKVDIKAKIEKLESDKFMYSYIFHKELDDKFLNLLNDNDRKFLGISTK